MVSVKVVGEGFSNAVHRRSHFDLDEKERWRRVVHSWLWSFQFVALLLCVLAIGGLAEAQSTTPLEGPRRSFLALGDVYFSAEPGNLFA